MTVTEKSKYAVLFDLDGTLVDSEPYWQAAEVEIAAKYGYEWTQAQGEKLTGNNLRTSAQMMVEMAALPLSVDETIDALLVGVAAQYEKNGVPWMAGVRTMLEELSRAGIATAVVSASYATLVERVVKDAPEGSLSVFVSGDDQLKCPKPYGDPYQLGAQKLGVEIENCLVVEDSLPGICAGVHSGAANTLIISDLEYTPEKLGEIATGILSPDQIPARLPQIAGAGAITVELVKSLIEKN